MKKSNKIIVSLLLSSLFAAGTVFGATGCGSSDKSSQLDADNSTPTEQTGTGAPSGITDGNTQSGAESNIGGGAQGGITSGAQGEAESNIGSSTTGGAEGNIGSGAQGGGESIPQGGAESGAGSGTAEGSVSSALGLNYVLAHDYGEEAYEKLVYIDKVLSDRDCISGENFKLAQKWITWELMEAGYAEEEVVYQDVTFTKYMKVSAVDGIVADYTDDGLTYNKSGKNYVAVEDGSGDYVKATITSQNLVLTKKGKSDKQIIVGAHYDGTGTGDNGSGVALALTTAQHLYNVETEYTIVFVFFTGEEYGLYGSTAYANSMTEEEIANTLYMINMDSLVCGDYTYIYGGVQDDEAQTVTQAEAYYNAAAVAEELGLTFKSNPWTYENPAPGYDVPDYAAPSTGDWSDHVGFKNIGIKYLYFEATNWDIPGPYDEYDGYGETYLIGMLMNTSKDYLDYIEYYFPGRPLAHLTKFSALLNALLTQSGLDF